MRVENRVLKNVAFVGIETNGSFTPLGTGFLVRVCINDDIGSNYLVTADHVVEMIRGDTVFVRVNRPTGAGNGCVTISIPKARLRRHPEPKNDVAILPFPFDGSVTDHVLLPMDRAHLESSREVWSPGIGDEAAGIGLYTSHYGEIRNRPVVRIGNIAAMPEEPVRTDHGYVNAYLVEIRSIGGLSGSPVYLNVPQFRIKDGEIQTRDNCRKLHGGTSFSGRREGIERRSLRCSSSKSWRGTCTSLRARDLKRSIGFTLFAAFSSPLPGPLTPRQDAKQRLHVDPTHPS